MAAKRPIFDEVSADQRAPAPAPGLIDRDTKGARGTIRIWLGALFLLVAAMILVGGLTRLTDSGLSIPEWRPVSGALPPGSEAAWQTEFEKYQAIPEYQLQNRSMSLAEFKMIYWWEWGHRQLGRFIGLVWAAGFIWFLARRQIPPRWTGRLLVIGALGGLQGAIGWWMVASGLSAGMVDVASYRLAIHLGLAFAILGLIAVVYSKLRSQRCRAHAGAPCRKGRLSGMATAMAAFAFLQILLGALVAGIDAGRTYTDWPLMAGGVFPPDPFALSPWWRNFFEDPGLVQFMHRISGYALVIYGIVLWRASRASGNAATRRSFDWMAMTLLGQMALGIATVLNAAPVGLALLHQAVAIVLWVLILNARFCAKFPRSQMIRG